MRHLIRRNGLAVLSAALLLGFAAQAQAQTGYDRRMTRDVLSKLHHVNQMEIRLGTLAMAKGQSQEVRSYGRRLRNDHTRNDRQVMRLADREGIELRVIAPDAHERALSRRLRNARGYAFDSEFLNAMAQGHAQVLQEMREAHRNLRDPEVRRLIGDTLPALRSHRNMAREYRSQI
jgi:putative membrane protein